MDGKPKTAGDDETAWCKCIPAGGDGNDPGGRASGGLADRGAAWLATGWLAARRESTRVRKTMMKR